MIAAAGGSARDVLISLKVVPDKTNAATFRGAARDTQNYEKQVRLEAEATEKWRQKVRFNSIDAMHRAEDRAAREATTRQQQVMREAERTEQWRQRVRFNSIQQSHREEEKLAAAQRRAAAQAEAGHRQVLSGVRSLDRGVQGLTRSFVYMAAAGGESMQKVAQHLLVLEAAISGIQGAVSIGKGLGRLSDAAAGGSAMAGSILTAAPFVAAGAAAIGVGVVATNNYIGDYGGAARGERRLELARQYRQAGLAESADAQGWAGTMAGNAASIRNAQFQRDQEVATIGGQRRSASTIRAGQLLLESQSGQMESQAFLAGRLASPAGQMYGIQAEGVVSSAQNLVQRRQLRDQEASIDVRMRLAESARADALRRQKDAQQRIDNYTPGAMETEEFSHYRSRYRNTEQFFGKQHFRELYEREQSKPAYQQYDRDPSRFADQKGAIDDEVKARQQIKDLQSEKVDLVQKENALQRETVQSLQGQMQAYRGLQQSATERLFSSQEAFAMMGSGQQHHLLRNFNKFNQGDLTGRRGVREANQLVGAGLIERSDQRFQELVRSNVPQGAFDNQRKTIDEAKQAADAIQAKLIEALKQGIKGDEIADEAKSLLQDAAKQLAQAMIDALQDELRKAARDRARQNADGKAKDSQLN